MSCKQYSHTLENFLEIPGSKKSIRRLEFVHVCQLALRIRLMLKSDLGCDLNDYKTPGHDNLQQTCGTGSNNSNSDNHNKNTNKPFNKSNKGGVISVISSEMKNRMHRSIKTNENSYLTHSIRWQSMNEIHGNNPAPTTVGISDVGSNCTKTKIRTATITPRRKHRTAKELIHEFCHSTSMHGVHHVMGHRSVWRRIVWSLLIIGFVTWAVYNVYLIVSDYNSHPVQTSVSSEYQGKMNFPAVTICNLNRIRLSKTSQFLLGGLQSGVKSGVDAAAINNYIDYFLRQFGRQQQREMGHQMQDMLVKCKFGNEVCTSENFTFSYNLQHGSCYTFAGRQTSNRSEWLAMRAGPGNGLSMEFDVQFDEYLPSTTASGLKVLIHDNGELPFPEDGGIMAGTGAATSIAIREVCGLGKKESQGREEEEIGKVRKRGEDVSKAATSIAIRKEVGFGQKETQKQRGEDRVSRRKRDFGESIWILNQSVHSKVILGDQDFVQDKSFSYYFPAFAWLIHILLMHGLKNT
ncbi:acid-sensing ion channel 4-like [Plakobranchus ocellatus]|uniref:Acid-sensing ion channel 4-like n=1 Tax=Plakobranchus ocellatus TaxID=259542 RepID=A0AAV3ZQ79_9GAST|nr:acid-sensing ion channel 4-like [Plakobranchus ocellatus]